MIIPRNRVEYYLNRPATPAETSSRRNRIDRLFKRPPQIQVPPAPKKGRVRILLNRPPSAETPSPQVRAPRSSPDTVITRVMIANLWSRTDIDALEKLKCEMQLKGLWPRSHS